MGFFDRRGLPTQLASEIPKKERVMAWAQGPERLDGEPTIVVTTDRACMPTATSTDCRGNKCCMRAGRIQSSKLSCWTGGGSTEFLRITLDNAGSVPQVVFDRVTSTIVMRSRVELVGKRGATLVARRDRESDEVRWEVVFDAGSTLQTRNSALGPTNTSRGCESLLASKLRLWAI